MSRKGEGQIKKIGQRFYLRVAHNGTRYDIATGKTTEPDAEAWRRSFLKAGGIEAHLRAKAEAVAAAEDAKAAEEAKVSFEKAIANYHALNAGKGLAPKTIADKITDWHDFTAFASSRGIHELHGITTELTSAYLRLLSTKGKFQPSGRWKRSDPMSPSSIIKVFAGIKTIFNASNIKTDPPPFKIGMPRQHSEKREIFSIEELDRIIAAADDTLKPVVLLCAHAGLRLKDAAMLKRESVDLKSECLRFIMAKTKRAHSVPMTPEVLALFKSVPLSPSSPYAFPEIANLHLNIQSALTIRFRNLLKRLGIESQTKIEGRFRLHSVRGLHALRHSFVYHGLKTGNIPQAVMQGLVGHLTPSMTRLYADHADDLAKAEAMKAHPFSQMKKPNNP